MENIDILALTREELAEHLGSLSFPKYRTQQIFTALHRQLCADIADITTLSLADRKKLGETAHVPPVRVAKKLVSSVDGTVKYLFELADGQFVEGVLMRYRHGNSVCLSTQAGCRMGCSFCASTIAGYKRNLTAGEILGQVYAMTRGSGERISNIVLMGIGEPLDNFDNVMAFLQNINSPDGLNISLRHISLSTCGLVDGIKRLMEQSLPITLSVSLHAPYDEMRSSMMPVNRRWGIDELIAVCKEYCGSNNRRISYEYAMIDGVNDSVDCAARLCELLDGYQTLSHINLIPVNRVEERSYRAAQSGQIKSFIAVLEKKGFAATVRRHLGGDIDASCGQLRAQEHGK